MATPKHTMTGDEKIAGIRATEKFGNQGNEAIDGLFGANTLFPPSTMCTLVPENVYKQLGQVGLKGQKLADVIVGQNVAGGFEGDFHFLSDPSLTAIATIFEEKVTYVDGTLHDHYFRFGQNFVDTSITNSFSGSLEHQMHVAIDFGNNVLTYHSFKGNTLELTFDRDEGIKYNVQGHAFSGSSYAEGVISSAAWTQREPDYTQDIGLISNLGDFSLYMTEYAADTTVAAGDLIQGADNVSFSFNQANEVKPTTATGIGIDEPRKSANGAEVTATIQIMYGNDDAFYGRRYWGDAFLDGTKVQIYLKCNAPNDQYIEVKMPCGIITGGAVPIVSSATGEEIGLTITVVGRIANATLTNTFADLGNHPGQILVRNTRAGEYLSV